MTTETTFHATPAGQRTTKSIARHLPTAGRALLGLIFVVFGLNGFLNFLPRPTAMPEGAMAFAGALMNAGYFFPLLKGIEVIVGALLLSNRFVPLALAVIAPVVVNIFAFHAFLAPSGIGFAIVVVALEAYLAWTYRSAYRAMLAMRVATGN